jgi:hypothetical protein
MSMMMTFRNSFKGPSPLKVPAAEFADILT